MKFLVDAHLPASLCRMLSERGYDVRHTRDLAAGNRASDEGLIAVARREQRVVVTKDADFYHSHLLRGEPEKLVLIRVGNLRKRDLPRHFSEHLPALERALRKHGLVELVRKPPAVVTL
jgi:predicted nuclease of predicted toxin-antitoxin system